MSGMDSETSGPVPSLSQPHRRMSRADFGGHMVPGRRMSIMNLRRGSVANSLRTDQSQLSRPYAVKLENTYRLEPKDGDKFNVAKVETAVKSILESFLVGETYEPVKCGQLSRNLADVIKTRVKEMHFPRYKIVSHVIVGQKADQNLLNASRCVWNTSTDTMAVVAYEKGDIFTIATVYGLYYE